MKRKLLSVLLTFCLAFSLLPTAALAEGEDMAAPTGEAVTANVAKIGETEYPTLAEAVAAAKDGQTVKMLNNTKVTQEIYFSGKTITLDLNGKIITGQFEDYYSVIEAQGTAATLIVEDTSAGKTGTIHSNHYGLTARDDGNITVNSGTIIGDDAAALSGNNTTGNMNFTVNGGTLTAGKGPAIYQSGQCKLTITGGTLNGGISLRMGQVNISGGTINAATENLDSPAEFYNYSGNAWLPDALYVFGGTYDKGDETYGNSLNLNITGGTFNCTNGQGSAVAIYDLGKVTQTANVKISGGKFATTTNGRNAYDVLSLKDIGVTNPKTGFGDHSGAVSSAISGGTFSSDVSAYCEKNYYTERNEDNTYTVKSMKDVAVAKIGDTYYKTLAKAVAAADNATVTLLKNTTEDITIASDKTVTLDLAGHKLTNVSGHTITNNGTLFVTGNGTVDNIAHGKGALYNNTGATATLNGGTFTRSAEKGTASPDSANGNSWYTVKNYGTMTINSNVTITNTGSHSSAVANGWFDVSKAGSNGEPIYTTNAVLTINGGNISGGKITVKNDDYGTLTITGGSISQPLNGLYCIYNANVTAISGGNVNGPVGNYNGTSTEADQGKFSITGGYFTSDPSSYKAADRYVVASDVDGYTYMVTATAPTDDQKITVVDKTNASVDPSITGNDKTAIESAMSSGKTNVDGVAEAVSTTVKTGIVNDAKNKANNVPTGEVTSTEIEVKVNVSVTEANLSEGSMTFKAEPVANVKVNGIKLQDSENKPVEVPVSNAMLNGKPITVKLPLPTVDGKLFTPKQIKHTSSDGSVEYFLDTQKTGAKTFEIKDGCAVFTITKFSTFELSGTVTYVEPSYSSGSSSDPTYSVSTPSKTEHGTVTVSPKSASKGDRVTVTVKPDSGYVLETLTVTDKNGNELTLKDKGNGKYTFTMPAGKVEVKATFMEDNSMLNFFYDVPNNAYFYEAVKWAVKNGITTGVGNDLFAPEQPCTRAQIVTFLWRAAGSPEPKGAASGMSDVVSGSYYEKAVAWAIENGITTGTTTSTFSPDATCTRAQAVTFLARALKAKAASAAEFSDVPTDSYFADAVAWAAANGVTEGIGGGLFGSDNDCTRGQIVTFLYRAYNK